MKKILLCALCLTNFLAHAETPSSYDLTMRSSVRAFHCKLDNHEAFKEMSFYAPMKIVFGEATGDIEVDVTLLTMNEFYTLKVPSIVKSQGNKFPNSKLEVNLFFTYPGGIGHFKGEVDFTGVFGEIETTFTYSSYEDEDDDQPLVEEIKATCRLK